MTLCHSMDGKYFVEILIDLIEYRCIVRGTCLCRDVMIDTVGVLVA